MDTLPVLQEPENEKRSMHAVIHTCDWLVAYTYVIVLLVMYFSILLLCTITIPQVNEQALFYRRCFVSTTEEDIRMLFAATFTNESDTVNIICHQCQRVDCEDACAAFAVCNRVIFESRNMHTPIDNTSHPVRHRTDSHRTATTAVSPILFASGSCTVYINIIFSSCYFTSPPVLYSICLCPRGSGK